MTVQNLVSRLTDFAMNQEDDEINDLIKETIDKLTELEDETRSLKYAIHDYATERNRTNLSGMRCCC